MNKALKITLISVSVLGIGVLVYLMFIKKSSRLYVLKRKDADGVSEKPGESEDNPLVPDELENPVNNVIDTISTALGSCEFPKTPFTSRAEGNAFRGWVNDNYPAIAKEIDLDRTGQYNNCWIRESYAYKTTSGKTLGELYVPGSTGTSEPQLTLMQKWDNFEGRLRNQSIPFNAKNVGSGEAIEVKMKSSTDLVFKIWYGTDKTWGIYRYYKQNDNWVKIARGTFNLDSMESGTRLAVVEAKDTNGISFAGKSYVSTNSIMAPIRAVIKKKYPEMTDAVKNSIKPY